MKDLQERLKAALLKARDLCDVAEKANRDFTPEERTQLAGYMDEAKDLKAKIAQKQSDDELRKMVAGWGFDAGDSHDNPPSGQPDGKGTIGEQFVNAEVIKAWQGQFPGGRIPESMKGLISPPVEFKSLFGRKTLITGDSVTSAGAFVQTDYTGIYEPLGRMELNLRQLISVRTTGSDLVEFVRQTAKVTQAATVPEANVTDYAGATGEVSGEKPEGAMAFEKVTAAVKTLAVWVPATKRALSDAAQIRGIIDQELRDDLNEELEDQILNGDGTDENFTGILNTSGILTQSWSTDVLTTTRKAKTALMTTGRARPTAWVINPSDWEMIELLKDGENRYYWGGPMANGPKQLWGVPIVESEAIDEGTALLGDWRKAVMWDRERATLQISDSHSDFFIRNMVAFLAEMRAAFGVIRPSGFISVAMESGS